MERGMKLISILGSLLAMAAGKGVAAPVGSTAYSQLIANTSPGPPAAPPGMDASFVDSAALPAGAHILSAARSAGGAIWVVTDSGAFRLPPGMRKYERLGSPRALQPLQPPVPVDTVVTCVATDGAGHILAGSNFGLFITDGANWWQHIDRRDGMPFEEISTIVSVPNGDVWAGSAMGAWRLRAGRFRYFAGKRWLPDNAVRRIWPGPDGSIWITTNGGTSHISEQTTTLGAKAKQFNDFTQRNCNRRGFINERSLDKPGTLDKSVFSASDNDGLWNAIYVAAMSYRFAATHDPEARDQAWQAMKAMLELERLTGISGFPARAVVTDAEIAAGVTGFDANDTVRVPGETDKIWFRSTVDKSVWCKGDTSSDELDGHYYAWRIFYDLAATPAQKAEIAATCRRVTDNIIAGGFNLIGHTGRKTRWAIFAPSIINDDPAWADQRALNSLELTGYMKVAAHVTGDARYERICDRLISDNHYLLNTLNLRVRAGGEWQNINHSDDEMAMMDFTNLLALEKDESRRRIVELSLRNTWEDTGATQAIKQERSPWYNFAYGGLTGNPCAPDEATQTLQDWPMDRFAWSMSNSGRTDVTFKTGRGLHAQRELTSVLPISERALQRWNGNPFEADGGAEGRVYDDGAAFLLGYWAGVYYGYLPVEKP